MSKRDDEASDMEVGMTTAERRRRRRRGGGLRVPSDNVPRRSSTSPPVAPVPEDPSLAMSIAYSFSNEPSTPVPRVDLGDGYDSAPVFTAPEAASTVIDPPSGGEGEDFEMRTREMSAVDLDALGLSDSHAATTLRVPRISSPNIEVAPLLTAATPPPTPVSAAAAAPTPPPHVPRPPVLPSNPGITPPSPSATQSGTLPMPTVVEAVRVEPVSVPPLGEIPSAIIHDQPAVDVDVDMSSEDSGSTLEPVSDDTATRQLDAVTPESDGESEKRPRRERIKTVALTDEDLEEVREKIARARLQSEPVPIAVADDGDKESSAEPMSVPDIYIHELAEKADAASEFEVDVDEPAVKAPPVPPPRPSKQSGLQVAQPPATPPDGHARARPPSIPPQPPPAPAAALHPPPPPPPAAAQVKPPAPPGVAAKKPAPTPLPKQEKPSRGKPWFVDLFDEDYLRTLPFLTPQATQAEAEFVIDAMGLSPGAQVLDVGCGYGRHAMELAARGFHVVGLDMSTPLLVRGGEEAHRRGLTINFIRGDMRELDFDAQFDAAYCLFSTFGYFDDETNKKTASNIARALKPGGRVMFEILNRDYVIADLPTRVWWEGEGCVVLEEVELNYFSSRIQVNRSVVFDDGRQLEQEISVRAYSLHEVGKLMHSAGFRVLEVSGGYHTRGRFFGNQSRHIIVLAERKDPSAS